MFVVVDCMGLVEQKTVVVGMSGGVDSSVAALLLREQGYTVIGVFMKNWSDEFALKGECPWEQDHMDARMVAQQLDIPLYTFNFESEYKDKVIEYFFAEYKAGRTPNPDILCNSEIKFKAFFEKALELGADYIATGHYARVQHSAGKYLLLKGADANKDQSYFLYAINPDTLPRVLFPLGDMQKSEVRDIARTHNLKTQDKKDSQGICFIGEVDLRKFLSRYIHDQPGDIVDVESQQVIGQHTGLSSYTIGQRRGMSVGGTGIPLYVAQKDMQQNILYVAKGNYNPALFAQGLTATDLHWLVDRPAMPQKLSAKIRYRQTDQACAIDWVDDTHTALRVVFDEAQRAITPGQSLVLYDDDVCLGGGSIADTFAAE